MLAKALEKRPLRHVNLEKNPIQEKGIKALKEAIGSDENIFLLIEDSFL